MRRRVVVTGLGLISPVGNNVITSWETIISGGSGLTQLKDEDYSKLPCKVAAVIPNLNISDYINKNEIRTMSLASAYALIASKEALNDANWLPTDDVGKEKTGVCVGMGMVDLVNISETAEALKKGYNRVSPYFVPRILPNMAAGLISIKYGFKGPNHSVSTACATGAHAIGDAFKFIQNGYADVMVCGGAEAAINPISIAGFCRCRALSTSFNDRPTKASRPFDKDRDGFVMGEGSAILILEERTHAIKRSAKIYAEILGYGLSGDGSHLTAPSEDGRGAALAMTRAINDASIKKSDITYINAHATSTPMGDDIELRAIKTVFGEHSKHLAISSTKGAHGHLLGAAERVHKMQVC
ncbi:3-oxoacyl-[acyl-carrier-protein] synthase, mitochondrial isoform X3 [Lycorma delicatula]|uniref:3-oxoacyl-[acyl-carrier-protein] synthase, mitochondrial isoform X3 n=1 Tax=Lycorma delicatula TaxID=130591 RepID=UPI003F518812